MCKSDDELFSNDSRSFLLTHLQELIDPENSFLSTKFSSFSVLFFIFLYLSSFASPPLQSSDNQYNKFEDQYNARKLGNWEYPKWYPERPRQRTKSTKIIANDNGHLLDGIKKENPWGNYLGTWDLPRRITRDFAEKLAVPPERVTSRWQKKDGFSREKKAKAVQEESLTDQANELCKLCYKEKCACDYNPPSESSSGEAVKCGEALTCTKCQNAVCICESNHLPALQTRGYLTSLDSFQKRNRSSSALDLRPKLQKITPSKKVEKDKVKPNDIPEKVKEIIESIEEKKTPPLKLGEISKEIRALPPTWKEREKCDNDDNFDPVPKSEEGTREYLNYLDKHLKKFELDKTEVEEEEEEKKENDDVVEEKVKTPPESPKEMPNTETPEKIIPGYQIAKRYQEENLRHQPLPDVIEDPVFKALNSSRHPNPGINLNLQPNAAAIGWKGYVAPGPTQCSKMRIYRPKTAVTDQIKGQKNDRPKTSDPKLTKPDKHFTQMELAICWDLIPEDPSDEPKPSPHIDGSNGSIAPAVFSIVRPEIHEDESKQKHNASPQAVAERILPDIERDNVADIPSKRERLGIPIVTNKEAIMTHIKPISKQGSPDSLNSITSSAAEIARKNPKTAWTGTDTSKTLSRKLLELQKENKNPNVNHESRRNTLDSEISRLSRKKVYQSSPNLVSAGCQTNRRCSGSNCGTEKSSSIDGKEAKMTRRKIRSCDYCDRIDSNSSGKTKEKAEFKSAFKAGLPNNGSSNSTTPPSEKPLKIPKMRLPYAKRSYSISTLIPPFSLWPDHHGQDYPDHWRLASVYQHSYKPIDYRKKSLLASVFQ